MSESRQVVGGFWEHVDALRAALFRIAVVTVGCGIVAFLFKDEVFAVVLAPREDSFVTYRVLYGLAAMLGGADGGEGFSVNLINTGLAGQFMIHVKTALCVGVLCASPYILYMLFGFVAPALYSSERRYVSRVVVGGYVMFMVGVLTSYFVIFPLTFRFLGTYEVASDVANMISLQSYMETLVMMSLSLGLVFELPVLAWLLAKLGFVTSGFMRRYRKHAIVVILLVGAIITPTSDVVTLLLVSLPMYALYEASILLVRKSCGR